MTDNFFETSYIYLEIPEDWLCIYHKLLHYLADFGEDALKNCDTTCKGDNKNIIKCWGMFQSALAAKSLNKDKLADVLIKYIDAQLELIYNNSDEELFNSGFILPIDENGYLKGLNSCGNNISFYLHNPLDKLIIKDNIIIKPGYLYAKFGNNANKTFYIENNNLYVEEQI